MKFNKAYLYHTAFLILMIIVGGCSATKTKLPKEDLRALDQAMKSSRTFESKVHSYRDSLKAGLSDSDMAPTGKIDLMIKLSESYRLSLADSSLAYSTAAKNAASGIGDDSLKFKADLALVDALSASGLFTHATLLYDSLHNLSKPEKYKIEYFLSGRRIYSNIIQYTEGTGDLGDFYRSKYIECDDSLLSILPEGTATREFIACERLVDEGKYRQVLPRLEKLLSSLDKADNLYGMTAFQVAKVHKSLGHDYQYASYLAKAAESDIRGNIKEGYALPALAEWLYLHGEFDDAFRYINYAMEDAYESNARVRIVSIARWIPAIDEAYRKEIRGSRNELFAYGIFITIILAALGVLTFLFFREMRKNRMINMMLASTSRRKDTYIGNFIALCSTYSEKYNSLLKLIDRKISSGQAADLLKSVKSGKIEGEQDEEFYREIDGVILALYPDFVDKVNELLNPDERIEVKAGHLTPELRIYAFVRLGVAESTRIAKILNYSVNTVYAYRNRMRNRATDRDNFEENILKIGDISTK